MDFESLIRRLVWDHSKNENVMVSDKHAYLIMAHNELEVLRCLLNSLDHEYNNIFVHIDGKADFDGKELTTRKSKLIVLPTHIDGRWGDFSLVEIELLLFKTAYNYCHHSYYHLISGVDMPIKSQDEIHAICNKTKKTEYIGFAKTSESEIRWRNKYFLFSREFKSSNIIKRLLRFVFVKLQRAIGYTRCGLVIKKGSQWCSVTHTFVSYMLSKEVLIRKCFTHTYCPDELFIQTLCWNSCFRNAVYDLNNEFRSCKRFIKWNKNKIQTFESSDIDIMINSEGWFARKFFAKDEALIKSLLMKVL